MPVCPLDFRYGRDEAKSIFSHEHRILSMLQVEAALARAHASLGNIPPECADEITRHATLESVSPDRVDEIERETRHDVMALVKALAEKCSDEAGGYIHLGATSYDIVDTSLALQMKDGITLIITDLDRLFGSLSDLAFKYRDTPMLGRTHGQSAVPVTFGLKMAVFAAETRRHTKRLEECIDRVCVGKMSGAVGTAASYGKDGLELQRLVMKELGIGEEEASTQIVQRDRFIEAVGHLVNICTTVEKCATEVRNLQRSEIGEVAEAFEAKKQVGSSTMPHKQNPIVCENITGLARLARGFYTPLVEGAVQWHERDLSNSASERFVLPHVFILTDDILIKMADVFSNLRIFPERMLENLENSGGFFMAESVMMKLVGKGTGRQEAHEIVRENSHRARSEGKSLKDALMEDDRVVGKLGPDGLDAALDPMSYLGCSGEIVDRVLKSD